MSARAVKPVTVTLGEMGEHAERRVRSGRYASISEVMRAGLRALDREDAALDMVLQARVEGAIADARPTIGIDEAFDRIWERIDARRAGDGL